MIMSYSKWNTVLGWGVFAIATLVYLMTIEDTVSLWDCGEYITAAYKLEVGHPPGAPLFMVMGRLFSFFAAPENVAVWINSLSALSSSLTILFMFWSLTILIKKMILKHKAELSCGDRIAIFTASAIGALSYTFSDSFWFSAVEGEVYAMASLFTAVVFWAALKWDEEMSESKFISSVSPNRWLLLIMFLLGLAIGVHLLGILVIPAICYIIYFQAFEKTNWQGFVLTGVISLFTLGFIQEGVIPGSVALASAFEVSFVNSLGLPFFAGTIFFFIFLIIICVIGVMYARKKGKTILYNIFMGLVFLLIGYGSFAVIVIRSNANTPLDENDPENLVTLHSYLKREQYGSAPLLSGNYWNSLKNGEIMTEDGPQLTSRDEWKDFSPFYLQRFVIMEGDNDIKAFEKEADAKKWVLEHRGAYSIEEKYYESNASVRHGGIATYAQQTLFPRMYSEGNPSHQQGYENWSGYDPNDDTQTEIGNDGKRLPTFGENLTYFFRYQVNWMYIRYFMWNFAGRQNDIQGHGDNMRGNWLTGITVLDEARLGSQEFAPKYTEDNASHNRFFLLPLTLALIGLFFHFYRAPKDAFVLSLVFMFTGFAILVYLNQKPMEPRERDYAYAGSFYFFAMWIGIGVYALYDMFMRFQKEDFKKAAIWAGAILVLMLLADMGAEYGMANTILWCMILLIAALLIGTMLLLKKIVQTEKNGAVLAAVLGVMVPLIMAFQGWDDHDRSGKTSARDLAYNYLQSCEKNGIIFTNGDNDTFPLWYMQEVEGVRTDVRVCNLSLMGTDWYTNQMKMKAYESDPLPIKFREDQILMYAGNTDQVYFLGLLDLFGSSGDDELKEKVIHMRVKNNRIPAQQTIQYFNAKMAGFMPSISVINPEIQVSFNQLQSDLISNDADLEANIYKKYNAIAQILEANQSGAIKIDDAIASELQKLIQDFEKPWMSVDFAEAMAFVRDDANALNNKDGKVSFFPSSSFTLKVNKNNAFKSGVITKQEMATCPTRIPFEFDSKRDRYLTRDEIMMMDIVANNDWKRGIYFSSNRGSAFSIALLSSGYVQQVGMAYELNPMRSNVMNFYNIRKMDQHLSHTYSYGKMNMPGVLTDYYARRHTVQYRVNFMLLAEQFANKGNNKKACALLDMSLAKMPLKNVMDFGEVNQCDPMASLELNKMHDAYNFNGQDIRAKCSGVLHEYVQLYYVTKNKAKAEALGMALMDDYERIFAYYEHTDVRMSAKPDNVEDLYAALDACFKMYVIAADPTLGNKNGPLAKRIYKSINRVYKIIAPRMYSELEQLASNNGEVSGGIGGKYSPLRASLQAYLGGMGQHYGFIKVPGVPSGAVPSGQPVNMDLQKMIPAGNKPDSNTP